MEAEADRATQCGPSHEGAGEALFAELVALEAAAEAGAGSCRREH